MLLIRPPLVKRRPLKSVSVTDNSKSIEFGPRHATYNRANSTLALYYRIELKSPPNINKFIIMVYNASIDPLLY
jgi:ABC-type uncharacterized transport system substrate-binding protein